jgi:acyl transferase domain-containing protein
VDYVEVHGTGTAAGDPVEANWVGEHFGRRQQELVIGSVKGNIGHLEITSFLAQLSKACSLLRTGELAPQANLKTLNPAIHWVNHKIRVATTPERLVARDPSGKLLVSICSSGIGGANAHVVVEGVEPAAPLPATSKTDDPVLLIAGGLSPRSASTVGENIVEALSGSDDSVVDCSVVLGRRARSLTWRSFSVKQPGEQVQSFSAPVLRPRSATPIVFLFPGQGPQHINSESTNCSNYNFDRKRVQWAASSSSDIPFSAKPSWNLTRFISSEWECHSLTTSASSHPLPLLALSPLDFQ